MQTAKGSVVETSDEGNGMNAAKLLLVDRVDDQSRSNVERKTATAKYS